MGRHVGHLPSQQVFTLLRRPWTHTDMLSRAKGRPDRGRVLFGHQNSKRGALGQDPWGGDGRLRVGMNRIGNKAGGERCGRGAARLVRRARRREEGGGNCRPRKGRCPRGPSEPITSWERRWGGLAAPPGPQHRFSLQAPGTNERKGTPTPKKDRAGRALGRLHNGMLRSPPPSPRGRRRNQRPNRERAGYLSQLPAQGSPLPQTRGYYGLRGTRPVTSSASARASAGRPRPPRKSRSGRPGGGVCAGADRDHANSVAGLVFPRVALWPNKLLIARSCYVRKNKLLKCKSALFVPSFYSTSARQALVQNVAYGGERSRHCAHQKEITC